MSINFKIEESKKINGLVLIKPSINYDSRGNIWTSFLKKEIECLIPERSYFNHDKFSESKKNVLRGIHGDNKSWKHLMIGFNNEIFYEEPVEKVAQQRVGKDLDLL